jgi:adenylosuccinate lyase
MDSEPREEGHVDALTEQVEFPEEQIVHITETSKDILELISWLQTEIEKKREDEQGVT